MNLKLIAAIVVILLLAFSLFDLWNTGIEFKHRQRLITSAEVDDVVETPIYILPVVLLTARVQESEESGNRINEEEFKEILSLGSVCYMPNNSNLVPCVRYLSPTKEIEEPCAKWQGLTQEYRQQILNANEILLGLGKYGINAAGIKMDLEEFISTQTDCVSAINSYYGQNSVYIQEGDLYPI